MASENDMIVGIDIGTSAAKVLCIDRGGSILKARRSYPQDQPHHVIWFDTIKQCFEELAQSIDLSRVQAIAIASQVNTYILYNTNESESDLLVVDWRAGEGRQQLSDIKEKYNTEYFLENISMPHPDMVSYPLPRLNYIRHTLTEKWQTTEKILQPKDYLYYKMTGVFASDPFTWRGLSNIHDLNFSEKLLSDNNIAGSLLPELCSSFDAPAALLDSVSQQLGLNNNVPVYLGCNDFFAALIGMGITGVNQSFDVTGTSEHIGVITSEIDLSGRSISGPFFNDFVRYGGTAGSGSAIEWAIKNFASQQDNNRAVVETSCEPIFLPYLNGERAPVWDSDTRGVFFGLQNDHDCSSMLDCVKEGVVFSLYHIWKELQLDTTSDSSGIRVAGAAAADDTLNQLKADIFQKPFLSVKEIEATAMGAAIIAAVGHNWFQSIDQAVNAMVEIDREIKPNLENAKRLKQRFTIYEQLYPALKDIFHQLGNIRRNMNE
jgi:sugar (pentulose or hexulose) kinase